MSDDSTYSILTKATKLSPTEGETWADFRNRLVRESANVLDDDVWDSLPEVVTDWVNDCASAYMAGVNMPDIPGGLPAGVFVDCPEGTQDQPELVEEPPVDQSVDDQPTDPVDQPQQVQESPAPKEDKPAPKKKAKKRAKKKVASKEKSATKRSFNRSFNFDSPINILKRVILINPAADYSQVLAKLEEAGVPSDRLSPNTIKSYFTDLHGTIKVLDDVGWKRP